MDDATLRDGITIIELKQRGGANYTRVNAQMSTYTRASAGITAALILIADCGCSADAVAPLPTADVFRTGGASSLGAGGAPGSGSVGAITGGSSGASTDGGASSSGGAPADGGTPASGGTPADGGTPASGGESASGGTAATGGASEDGGASASGGSGGPTTKETPGTVLCGEETCDLTASSANACCVRTTLFASRCGTALTACALNGGMTFTCDDSSDCTDGEVCCSFYLNGVTTTRCEASCAGLGAPEQLCRIDAECGDKKCLPSEVIEEYDVCR